MVGFPEPLSFYSSPKKDNPQTKPYAARPLLPSSPMTPFGLAPGATLASLRTPPPGKCNAALVVSLRCALARSVWPFQTYKAQPQRVEPALTSPRLLVSREETDTVPKKESSPTHDPSRGQIIALQPRLVDYGCISQALAPCLPQSQPFGALRPTSQFLGLSVVCSLERGQRAESYLKREAGRERDSRQESSGTRSF